MTKTVFIVEDDEDIGRNLSELLEIEGYQVQLARDGQAALEKLRANSTNPSLILLDLRMPKMDGVEFRKHQEMDPKLAPIPVVIMTADGQIEAKRYKVGAQAYVKKPLDLDTVLELVSRFCAEKSKQPTVSRCL